jgi:hypothetical protein
MLAFLVLFTATVTILQIRSWTALIAIYVAIGANVVVSWRNSKRHMPAVVILGVTFVLGLAFERVGGPFVLTPILISAMIPTLSGIPWVADRRWVLLAWTMALGLAPFALEWLGVVSRTWWQTEGGLLSSGAVVDSQGPAAMFATVSASLMFLLVIAVYSHQSSVDRRSAQQRLFIHSWHLRQLLPHGGV